MARLDAETRPRDAGGPIDPAPLSARWMTVPAAEAIREDWMRLAAGALERNVFHEPEILTRAVPFLAPETRMLAVSRPDHTLAALVPVTIARAGFAVPIALVLSHDFGPWGAPLIDAREPTATWITILTALRHAGHLVVRLRHMIGEGPLAQSLDDAARGLALATRTLVTWQRPVLAPDGAPLRVPRILRRHRNRLAREADLGIVEIADPHGMPEALDRFMALETAGWKGRAGTSLLQRTGAADYTSGFVLALSERGAARIIEWRHGDRTLASALMLGRAPTVWGWKIAYDPAFAKASPGRQLLAELGRLMAGRGIARIDSLGGPGGSITADLWPDRIVMTDRLIGLTPHAGARLAGAALDARLHAQAKATAKRLMRR